MHPYSKFAHPLLSRGSDATKPLVLVAPTPDPTSHPQECAPMEQHMAEEGELVYPVRSLRVPSLRLTRGLAGRKSLSFEGLVAGEYVEALAGPWATHSISSAEYLRSNNISPSGLSCVLSMPYQSALSPQQHRKKHPRLRHP